MADVTTICAQRLEQVGGMVKSESNDSRRGYLRDRCIHELFEGVASRSPDRAAVIFEDQQLTYRELNGRSNQLADHLKKHGVGPRSVVGICLDRSVEMVVGILGILKAGAAWLPLDPAYPKNRLVQMLESARPRALVTKARLVTGISLDGARLVDLDDESTQGLSEHTDSPSNEVTGDQIAYVIYTSGSTGAPKGVMISHANLSHYIWALAETLRISQETRYLHTASFSFSSSVRQLFLPLSRGATVILASHEQIRDPLTLFQEIKQRRVTVIDLVPSYWRSLTNVLLELEGGKRAALLKNDLKLILSASEPLPVDLPKRWFEFNHPARVVNMYGQTETTGIVALYHVQSVALGETGIVPIGRPIPGTRLHVLDPDLQPVPTGEQGELYVGGAGVGTGYLNQPGLTAERFLPDPFTDEPRARLYRTGDFVSIRPDESVKFLGRCDDQVKIRGHRVEVGEIESTLSQHTGVREAVVVAREDVPGDKRLVAYIVASQNPLPLIGEFREYLKQKLPDYMVPSAFVVLESLPLTPNGKLNRRALPVPDQASRETGRDFAAPTQTVEHQLVQIWEEILETHPIGIRDNFFDLGGDSLLATKMVQRVEQVCGEKVPLSTLLTGPTIEHLANELVEGVKNRSSVAVKVQSGGSKPPFFFLHADIRGGGFYCLELARGLGAKQPFYILPPYGLDDRPRPPTVEVMAAEYIKMVRAVEPHGPYVLGGLCHGGLVAFEMAQQLQRQGEKINLVAMVGPTPSNSPRLRRLHDAACAVEDLFGLGHEKRLFLKLRRHWIDARQFYRHVDFHLREVAKVPLGQQAQRAFRLVRRVAGRFETSLYDGRVNAPWQSIPEGLQKLRKAIATYVRRPYSGRVAIFWPVEEPVNMLDEPTLKWDQVTDKSLGWSQVVRNLEVYPAPSNYVNLVTKDINVLVGRMKDCLERAQTNGRRDE